MEFLMAEMVYSSSLSVGQIIQPMLVSAVVLTDRYNGILAK